MKHPNILLVNSLIQESTEGNGWDEGDESVKLVLSILSLIAFTGKTNTDPVWNVSNTLAPNSLVKLGINTDVLSAHHLASKFGDGLESTRSALLEGTKMGIKGKRGIE